MYKLQKYTDEKFWVSEQIGFDNWETLENPIKNTGTKAVAVVYQTWSTEGYLPYIYHSLMSQLLYTDMLEKADVYLFVDEDRYEYTKFLFKGLIDESCIIKVSRMMAVKYMVTCHPTLHKYKVVAVCDSDMFFYSDKKTTFYADLEKRYEENDDILLIKSGPGAKEVFWARHKDLNKRVPKKEYIDYFVRETRIDKAELENWVETAPWHISCIFCYNPKTYINPKYYQYAITCAYNEFYCDETVWMVWAKARMVDIKAIQTEMQTVEVWLDFADLSFQKHLKKVPSKDKLFLVHPLSGPGRINPTCLEFIKFIQTEFKNAFNANL